MESPKPAPGVVVVDVFPVSKFVRRILCDPATSKLVSIAISLLSIFYFTVRGYSKTYIIINVASFLYSFLSLFVVVVWKNQDTFNSEFLNNRFGGRKIQWHEIQGTISFCLAVANLSSLAFMGYCNDRISAWVCLLMSSTLYFCEWYATLKTASSKPEEEFTPKCYKATKWILNLFKRFPAFFNFLRMAMFIGAVELCDYERGEPTEYFIYCTCLGLFGCFNLLVVRLSTTMEKKSTSKLLGKNKLHTFLSLFVTIHACLIVLSNGLTERYEHNGWWKDFDTTFDRCPISYTVSFLILIFSLMDLYSQSLFPRSTTSAHGVASDENEKLESIETGKNLKQNLPMTLENPFFADYKNNLTTY